MPKVNQYLLAPFVRRFLLEEVVANRNLSVNTQKSYRDAIRLLLHFMVERYRIEPTRVTVEQVTEEIVRAFLVHLEQDRGVSVSTRNQRLTAIHSLFRYVGRQVPELVEHAAEVRSISPRKTAPPMMTYLEKHELDALLAAPDRRRAQGCRDYALLLFLYNTGARASEAANVALGDLVLEEASSVRLFGKGRRIRLCPLWTHTVTVMRDLLGSRISGPADTPVFLNVRGQPITRFGIHDLVTRTARKAATATPSLLSKRVTSHCIRRTTAVHLLRAGVDINTIRAWLGHVSVETTNHYAEVDLEMKAKALETCAVQPDAPGDATRPWRADTDFLEYLTTI
jgi:site-specific recombinase XerD